MELVFDVFVKEIRYLLEYKYGKNYYFSWKLTEGDVKDIKGSYRFKDQKDGTTLVTVKHVIDPGMWVPAFIMNKLNNIALGDSLSALKSRVED